MPEPKAKQKCRSYHSLQKKTYARPAVWKCGEKTLQEHLFSVFSLRYWQQAQNAQTKVSASSIWGIYSSIIPRFNPIVTA